MIKFIIQKVIYGVLILLGVATSIFFLFKLAPGDPALVKLGQHANEKAVAEVHKDLGLDQPIGIQYLVYLNDISPISVHDYDDHNSAVFLNLSKYQKFKTICSVGGTKILILKFPFLRRSYITNRQVTDIIYETLPETAVLAFASIIIASVLGISLGIVCAIYRNTFIDKFSIVISVFGMATPSFLAGVIISTFFGYYLGENLGLNPTGSLYSLDDYTGEEYLSLKNLILPAITLGIRPLALVTQLMRSSLLEVLGQDYIRTAKAKGLSFNAIMIKHALKNSLNPVITAISGWFASLMAGAVFVEMIFSWKGIGYEVVDALSKNDLPVVMGATLVFAVIFMLIFILTDIIYGYLDPRVRIGK